MDIPDPAAVLAARSWTTGALRAQGFSRHHLSAAVRDGRLIRLRRGTYAAADLDARLRQAGSLGGRLDCVSLLSTIGIFVRQQDCLHVQLDPDSTRLPQRPRGTVAHWRPFDGGSDRLACDIVAALVQACRCQTAWDAIATLDSAWHLGFVDEATIGEIVARLPRRMRRLRRRLGPRCESGSETIMRLILEDLGCRIDVQVRLDGVGRIDFIVDGWLIVECDSAAHHQSWDQQRRDRRRDLAAARLGYTTIRPIAGDILFHTDDIRRAIAEVVAHGAIPARLRNSGLLGTERAESA